jgi:hypothetical protein
MSAAFGMSVMSNFPVRLLFSVRSRSTARFFLAEQHADVFLVRIFATYVTLTASVGALYCEMLLSFWIRPLLYSSRLLPIIRTVLTVISTMALVACKCRIHPEVFIAVR